MSKNTLNVNTAILAGAGSGHEPSFHGYVGQGGITASVAGQVFASPSTGQVLATLKLLSKSYKEILIVVNNYTGDRINFGLAVEQAKVQGIKSKLFCFGDDVAFQNNAKTGKRGLAGGAFLVKCLGSLAERGYSLEQLYQSANDLAKKIATMSVSLSSCDVPGSGTSFVLGPQELELGLGIHGEAGISRTNKLLSSKETVKLMVDSLLDTNKSPIDCNCKDVALLINNTGGLSNFELNVVVKDTIDELTTRGFKVKRLHVGTLCSSFSMIGVSISLMNVDDEILKLLDSPCDTPMLNKCQSFKQVNFDLINSFENEVSSAIKITSSYLKMPGVTPDNWTKMLNAAANSIIQVEELLNQLDKVGGDGDCGLTCKKGAKSILDTLKSNPTPSLLTLNTISNAMGGTSGAIYSLLFTSLHSSLLKLNQVNANDIDNMKPSEVASFWSSSLADAIDVVTKYSWAVPGDRTMLDTLYSIREALSKVNSNHTTKEIVSTVVKAAVDGSEATSKLPCRAGRASYVNCGSVVNSPDPGAVSVAIWVKAMASSLGYSESNL